MKRLLLSFVFITALGASVEAAKSPSDYFVGQLGAVDPDIVEALKKDIPMAKRVLAECMASKVALERRSCVATARYIGSAELANSLRIYLKDHDTEVRREAVQSLSRILGAEAIPWIAPLADDPGQFTRISVMGKLMHVGGNREDVRVIVRRKMTDDPDPEVRLSAAKLLAAEGEAVPRELALMYVDSSTETVRFKALALMGFVGDLTDLPRLDAIAASHSSGSTDAVESALLIRVRHAQTADERRQLLEQSFRDRPRWAAVELVRRYRLGEKDMLDIAEKIVQDATHPGYYDAKGALEAMKKYR